MKYAGSKAETYIRKPDPKCWAILAFGEDEGVAADAARAVVKAWGGPDLITMDEDAIKKEPALLFDALEAQSLLGGDRAIRIRTNGDKLASLILEAVKLGDQSPGRFAAKLVVTAGALAKRSKLRAGFETAKLSAALQFFADETGDIAGLVKTALDEIGASAEPGVIETFIGDLPGHRNLAHSEIEKLRLYAEGLGRALTIKDIRALSATDIDHEIGAAILGALEGKGAHSADALDRLLVSGTNTITVLRALQREALRMLHAHELDGTRNNVGMKLRPPVWQSEWVGYSRRLRTWTPKRLARILERVYQAEQQVKTAGATGEPMLRTLMNDLTRVGAGPRG